MAARFFSIPAELIPPEAADAQGPASAAAIVAPKPRTGPETPPMIGRWQTAEGLDVGDPVALSPPGTAYPEFPDIYGRMARAEASELASFVCDPEPSAAFLALLSPGRAPVRIAREALFAAPSSLPRPTSRLVGPAGARFEMPVFAERFDQWNDFIGHVEGLRAWVLTQPPFDQVSIGSRLAFNAMFWPSDTTSGLFKTDDGQNQGGRLFYGDRILAKQLLDPWIGGSKVSLILINSTLRGGAGGVPGYSAWTSITAAPGERWEAVCLHEVGHGLGLADEYVDSRLADSLPGVFEPNVSPDSRPSRARWKVMATLPDDPAPSFTPSTEAASPAGAIGTFQGARYRDDIYRAQRNCIMRDTRASFCAVCRAHIVEALQ